MWPVMLLQEIRLTQGTGEYYSVVCVCVCVCIKPVKEGPSLCKFQKMHWKTSNPRAMVCELSQKTCSHLSTQLKETVAYWCQLQQLNQIFLTSRLLHILWQWTNRDWEEVGLCYSFIAGQHSHFTQKRIQPTHSGDLLFHMLALQI